MLIVGQQTHICYPSCWWIFLYISSWYYGQYFQCFKILPSLIYKTSEIRQITSKCTTVSSKHTDKLNHTEWKLVTHHNSFPKTSIVLHCKSCTGSIFWHSSQLADSERYFLMAAMSSQVRPAVPNWNRLITNQRDGWSDAFSFIGYKGAMYVTVTGNSHLCLPGSFYYTCLVLVSITCSS